MQTRFTIRRATAGDVPEVAAMAGKFLADIMTAIDVQALRFNLAKVTARLQVFLRREKYVVFPARGTHGDSAGFVSLCERYALSAEGAFGTILERFVSPEHRSITLGRHLMS